MSRFVLKYIYIYIYQILINIFYKNKMSKLCFDDRVDVLVWMEYLRTEVATYVAALL
jgi:hypothetical protein